VVSPETAALITLFLADPLARLPAFPRLGATEYPFPVAVKTGTSQGYRNAWTVAYTREYVVGAWVGRADGRAMDHLGGAESAAQVVRGILLHLHRQDAAGLADLGFPPPSGYVLVRLCASFPDPLATMCGTGMEEWLPPAVAAGLGRGPGPGVVATPLVAAGGEGLGRAAAGPPVLPINLPPTGVPALLGQAAVRLKILSPENGARLLRDPTVAPELSTIGLNVKSDPPVDQILWLVDGRPYRLAAPTETVRWPLSPGEHSFSVRLPYRPEAAERVRIRVE
jgi:penicillin-binding protein 1C